MKSFNDELMQNVVDINRSDAIKVLVEKFVLCGYYCDRTDVQKTVENLGIEDSMLVEVIIKLNMTLESARTGNVDAIEKAEELKGMLPEVDGLVDRIIEDAKMKAKESGYINAEGFINVAESMENYQIAKEAIEQEAPIQ